MWLLLFVQEEKDEYKRERDRLSARVQSLTQEMSDAHGREDEHNQLLQEENAVKMSKCFASVSSLNADLSSCRSSWQNTHNLHMQCKGMVRPYPGYFIVLCSLLFCSSSVVINPSTVSLAFSLLPLFPPSPLSCLLLIISPFTHSYSSPSTHSILPPLLPHSHPTLSSLVIHLSLHTPTHLPSTHLPISISLSFPLSKCMIHFAD